MVRQMVIPIASAISVRHEQQAPHHDNAPLEGVLFDGLL